MAANEIGVPFANCLPALTQSVAGTCRVTAQPPRVVARLNDAVNDAITCMAVRDPELRSARQPSDLLDNCQLMLGLHGTASVCQFDAWREARAFDRDTIATTGYVQPSDAFAHGHRSPLDTVLRAPPQLGAVSCVGLHPEPSSELSLVGLFGSELPGRVDVLRSSVPMRSVTPLANGSVWCAAFGVPRLLAIGGTRGATLYHDCAHIGPGMTRLFTEYSDVLAIDFLPSSGVVVSGSRDSVVRLFDQRASERPGSHCIAMKQTSAVSSLVVEVRYFNIYNDRCLFH
jgi:hypothetical protein